MNTNEEKLQSEIEASKPLTGLDADAYRYVFSALKKEPEVQLPVNFARNVINKLSVVDSKKELKRDFLFLGFGLVLIGIAFIVAMLMTSFKFELGIFSFISGYKGLVIFGAAFITFLHWLDKQVVGKQHSF